MRLCKPAANRVGFDYWMKTSPHYPEQARRVPGCGLKTPKGNSGRIARFKLRAQAFLLLHYSDSCACEGRQRAW
jgi:hypothetical protein